MLRLFLTLLLLVGASSLAATALHVSAATGSSVNVPHYYTGNGSGFLMGEFYVSNPHTGGLVLRAITTTALGSGDDSTGFSEIGLYIDANNNAAFEIGVDQRYGQAYTAYPSDNGSLTFTEALAFTPGETKRFLIVGKLGGATPPAYNNAFHTIIQSIDATGGTPTGVPTTFVRGAAVINIPTPLRLEYDVTGTGPQYTYSFRLVLNNHDGSWTAGQEWGSVHFGQAAFGSGGTVPFAGWSTNSSSYPVGPFVSTGWSSIQVGGINYHCPILHDNISPQDYWMPAAVGDSLTWSGTVGTFLNEGEMSFSMQRKIGTGPAGNAIIEPAYRVGDYIRVVAVPATVARPGPLETGSGNGLVLGAFDLIAHSNAATFSGLTLAASGSGDDSSAFSEVRLYVDTNGNGAFDPGVDTPFGAAYTAFPADNGSLTFNDTLNLAINETKRLLVVCKLNGAVPANYGQTFQARVTAISATGENHSGLPTAAVAGLRIHAPAITVTTTGANLSAFANGQGPGGLGLGVAEFLLHNTGVNGANFGSITLAAGGSLFDHLAFAQVALYEDSNNSFQFDVGDTLYGTAAAGFSGDDGNLTFTQAATLAQGQWRRYFLVVKLNGTATVGDDFWVRVASLGVTGGTEAPSLGTLEQAFTIIPGSDPIGGTGGGTGGGSGGSKDSGGCIAGAANLLPLPILLAITRRRRARQAFVRR
ncbi:MAG: hypothetical protein KF754_05785 [Planctomycetes bacterium]|nr:hypothetical protein [Planctomycetota bacterium]